DGIRDGHVTGVQTCALPILIAALAGEGVHANDDVNMGQSSNDVFPSAVHLAALDELVNDLLPALRRLADSLQGKAAELGDVVKRSEERRVGKEGRCRVARCE